MKALELIRASIRKHIDYRRTLRELREMKSNVARDLGIDSRNVRSIAHRAVYGV